MRPLHRSLIAILLCLILPLQAGAAIARSVAVMTHGQPTAQATPSHALLDMQAGAQPADVHHHFHGAQHIGGDDHASHLQQHPQDHEHQKGDCQSCAKCCLMAVAAPPPVDIPPPGPAIARVLQLLSRTDFTTRFPDGPERPPRPLAA